MTEELKPCPWQMPDEVVHDVRVYDVDEGDSGTIGFTVSCNDCLIDGPQAMAKKRAVELWNRRASPWVRVEDELPPRGKDFFAIMDDGCDIYAAVCLLKIDSIFPARDEHYITHWMPIPKLTEEE